MFKSLYTKLFKTKKNEISFKQGLDLTGLPIITFNQGNIKLNFILDTGANYSIIDANYIDNIQYTPSNEQSSIYGMEGKERQTSVCNIDITYKDVTYSDRFLIADLSPSFSKIKQESGVILHGILGSFFFQKYQYVLDFKELIAYSQK